MTPTVARKLELVKSIQKVKELIEISKPKDRQLPIRLVAVSKFQSVSDISILHSVAGQIHFGENYAGELVSKAAELPATIQWHFIGGLQSNKCRALSRIRNLYVVESVDSQKKADQLNRGRGEVIEQSDGKVESVGKLGVMVQVNTSGEKDKSGCDPDSTSSLCRYIRDQCDNLVFRGLMTIGSIERSHAAASTDASEDQPEGNPDFVVLTNVRQKVCRDLGIEESEVELSMGMSMDYETAIKMGSDQVRVGTAIFGARPPKK